METILSAARLKQGGLHLGHIVGSFLKRRTINITYNLPYVFVIENLFSSTNFIYSGATDNILQIVEELYVAAQLYNYDLKVVFLNDIVFYDSIINSLLFENININHIRGIHPQRHYLRRTSDNIALSEYMFIVFELFYVLALDSRYVFMNDDNLPFINYARSVAKRVNKKVGTIFTLPYLETGIHPRLKGTDGERMSKSRDNCIFLTDTPDILDYKLNKLFSCRKALKFIRIDTNNRYRHIGNVISPNFIPFQYIDFFFEEIEAERIKTDFTLGRISISNLKEMLKSQVNEFLYKFRQKKQELNINSDEIRLRLNYDLMYVKRMINAKELLISNCLS